VGMITKGEKGGAVILRANDGPSRKRQPKPKREGDALSSRLSDPKPGGKEEPFLYPVTIKEGVDMASVIRLRALILKSSSERKRENR